MHTARRRLFAVLVSLVAALPAAALADPCTDNGETFLGNDCLGVKSDGCCSFDNELYVCRSVRNPNDTYTYFLCKKSCGEPQTAANCGYDPEPFGGLEFGSYRCGVPGTPEPDGEKPLICPHLCAGNCDGRACGSDGCVGFGFAGTCGSCVAELQLVCSNDGKCVCEEDCEGKECGSDGCGGFCGTSFCQAGKVCTDGRCVPGECTCTDKDCGDDGCGNPCGHECSAGWACVDNHCVCTPQCEGRGCGPDGCGGQCGRCPTNTVCDDAGQCVECVPQCAGRACGPDECGGLCGTCPAGRLCDDANGACVTWPPPDDIPAPPRDTGGGAESVAPAPDVPPDLPVLRVDSRPADSGFVVCPPGSTLVYGRCVATDDPPGAPSGGGGGCSGAPGTNGWVPLGLLALLLLLHVRRRVSSRGAGAGRHHGA